MGRNSSSGKGSTTYTCVILAKSVASFGLSFDVGENNNYQIRLLRISNKIVDVKVLCMVWRSKLLRFCHPG